MGKATCSAYRFPAPRKIALYLFIHSLLLGQAVILAVEGICLQTIIELFSLKFLAVDTILLANPTQSWRSLKATLPPPPNK